MVLEGQPAPGGMLAPHLPAMGARDPVDCGPSSEKCPLQKIMRDDVSNAVASADGPRLAAVLDRVAAAAAPEASWRWGPIARQGAVAARREPSHEGGAMRRRDLRAVVGVRARVLLVAPAALVAACAYANGYDPARYANVAPAASVDPEIEPLPASPKRMMRDPRGSGSARPVLRKPEPVDASPPEAAAMGVASGAAVAIVVAPAVVDAAAPRSCGSKADPCPMQRFMHGSVASAHTPDSLTTAFTEVAGMSPDPAWTWVAIATRGANLANAGDLAGAKAQCAACHDAYREAYRVQYRMRPL